MSDSRDLNPEALKRLLDSELCAATFIPLRDAIAPFLIEPFIRMLAWPYSKLHAEYPCWIIADLTSLRAGMTLAYSPHGHGSRGDPWGIVMIEEKWYGRDDSWFTCLEDAFINCGAWRGALPEGYEIR